MDAEVLSALIKYVKVGLVIVNTRILSFVGLLLCAGATAWTLAEPTWERVAATALFAVLAYWPIVRLDKGENHGRKVATEAD